MRSRGFHRAVWTGVASLACVCASAVAAAQGEPAPTGPAPGQPGVMPPVQPAAPPPQSPPVQPAPAQPTPVQPAPARPTPYYAPPPAAPYYAPPAPPPASQPEGPHAGAWFGGWLGVGGPYGADTATGSSADFKEGVGGLASVGYAFIPNLGVGAFLHYNTSKLEYRSGAGYTEPDSNSGHVLLYGLEVRGIVGSGFMIGYASAGIALGSGSLSLSSTQSGGGISESYSEDDSIDFKPLPVIGFGADAEVTHGLSIGPTLRWYVVSGDKACTDASASSGGTSVGNSQCTSEFGNFSLPDIVFVGVGATYRL